MSNCLIFALGRWYKFGGYIVARKSHYGWWPHFLWSADLITFEHYVPDTPKKGFFPPPLFKGTIVKGDKDGAA